MSITDARARNVKPNDKDCKVTDDRGLYQLVETNGSKLWRYKYRFSGKERTLAMGAYPEISLKEARIKRDEVRRLLDEGKDPSLEKQIQKALNISKYENNFEAGCEWYEVKLTGKSESHRSRSLRMLEKRAIPLSVHTPGI
ncbi:Arm DNA-binding domain-containing protein [Endozoicomonas acroporae]|uniref:Arm DNA-binding domain-containing protein n=1 Tax=Endozoicomonas acroporae TaxID=1701104 RepID=UPI003D798AAC